MDKRVLFYSDMEISEDIRDEIILLYNLGVDPEDLIYLLSIKLDWT